MLTRDQFEQLLEEKLIYLLKAGQKGASEQSLAFNSLFEILPVVVHDPFLTDSTFQFSF